MTYKQIKDAYYRHWWAPASVQHMYLSLHKCRHHNFMCVCMYVRLYWYLCVCLSIGL